MPDALHPAIGGNRYCGPGALAILTGKTTDETAAVLRAVSGKRAIRGINRKHMMAACGLLGLTAEAVPAVGSLQGWAGAQSPAATS